MSRNVPLAELHVPTVARGWAITAGVVLIMFGVVAFAWTGFDPWLEVEAAEQFLWFRLNPTQNLFHVLTGTILLIPATDGERRARLACVVAGVILIAATITGIVLRGHPDLNVLAFDVADDVLHGVFAAGSLSAAWLSMAGDPR